MSNFFIDTSALVKRYVPEVGSKCVINLDDDILKSARSLLTQHQLRTLDALQLASSLKIVKRLGIQLTFICAYTRLLAAASAEGLLTDNPNAHP